MSSIRDSPGSFTISTLLRDLSAGLVVFLVALPLCLGAALASNAPLFSGLVAGIIGGVLVGILSGSQTSVSGPAAGLTAIVAGDRQVLVLGHTRCGAVGAAVDFIGSGEMANSAIGCQYLGIVK